MFNDLLYPYPSRRSVTYGLRGMVATSQNLAAEAGLDILKKGGNAVDAAVATAMALTVLEPCSNGIGGDAFCILWINDKIYGLNSSGPAPMSLGAEKVRSMGHDKMPGLGMIPITVPGVPAAWAALSERFGKLPFSDLAESAIYYAKEGFAVTPISAGSWLTAAQRYEAKMDKNLAKHWFDTFTIDGNAPRGGQTWRLPGHAKTLEIIAKTKSEAFYKGDLADIMHKFFAENGGYITKEDLAAFKPRWIEPIKVNYRGYDIWELPPNGQGIVALMALKILNQMELLGREYPSDIHRKIEAVKIAATEGYRQIADPDTMNVSIEYLLSEKLADSRCKLITDRALSPETIPYEDKGTVYLCTADNQGNMVSYIQSNYSGFGSGVVIPGTGIAMQNRGSGFSLEDKHPNVLAPGKLPYHTIIPGFITKDGVPLGPFGVMGGAMQPQGHVQVITGMIDYDMNPQAALDAPRWQWMNNKRVIFENSMPHYLSTALKQMGHDIEYMSSISQFGRGQIIFRNPQGGYIGATEPRADGSVVAW